MKQLVSSIWKNIYFVRFRAGLRYWLMNSIVNRIPSWYVRRLLYRMFGISLGKGSRISLYTIIDYPKGISIGERTVINENCFLDGRGGLTIGNDVSISIYTKIITASHLSNDDNFKYYEAKVRIEDNVWIGAGAIILDGSILKKGSIIGAGCVYKGETEADSVYIGNPAVKVRKRILKNSYKLNYRPWMR